MNLRHDDIVPSDGYSAS